jgi:hypothetical protein
MDTVKLLWFFLWRMVLWGITLVALTYGAYGVLGLIDDLGLGLGWMISAFYVDGLHAAGVGFWLGLICGLVLFALTRTFYWPSPATPIGYCRAAGLTCALASALALLSKWVLDVDFPDAYAFLRPPGRPRDLMEVSDIVRQVLIPTLLFSGAMWWAGRRVAWRHYISLTEEQTG